MLFRSLLLFDLLRRCPFHLLLELVGAKACKQQVHQLIRNTYVALKHDHLLIIEMTIASRAGFLGFARSQKGLVDLARTKDHTRISA